MYFSLSLHTFKNFSENKYWANKVTQSLINICLTLLLYYPTLPVNFFEKLAYYFFLKNRLHFLLSFSFQPLTIKLHTKHITKTGLNVVSIYQIKVNIIMRHFIHTHARTHTQSPITFIFFRSNYVQILLVELTSKLLSNRCILLSLHQFQAISVKLLLREFTPFSISHLVTLLYHKFWLFSFPCLYYYEYASYYLRLSQVTNYNQIPFL